MLTEYVSPNTNSGSWVTDGTFTPAPETEPGMIIENFINREGSKPKPAKGKEGESDTWFYSFSCTRININVTALTLRGL